MSSLYPYTSFAKSALNSTSNGFLTCWKYSSFIAGGIVFAGTVAHCLYDTYKYGLSFNIQGKWTYLSSFIKQVYNSANSNTPIPNDTLTTILNNEFAKIKINKFSYIFSSTIISASLAPLITYACYISICRSLIFKPIHNLYNKYYYENPRFEFLTKRLLKIKQEEDAKNLEKDTKLKELFITRDSKINQSSFIEDKPIDCPICAVKLEDIDQPLSCGHYFHKECFMKTKNSTCPVCRTEVKLTFEEFKLINKTIINPVLNIETLTASLSNVIDENDVVMEEIE